MSVALDVGAILALFVAGVAIERFTSVEAVRRSIPPKSRTVLGGLALGGPWLLYFGEYVPSLGGTALVVTVTCTFVLWFAIPVAAAPVVGTRAASRC